MDDELLYSIDQVNNILWFVILDYSNYFITTTWLQYHAVSNSLFSGEVIDDENFLKESRWPYNNNTYTRNRTQIEVSTVQIFKNKIHM